MFSEAKIITHRPAVYLQRLCKHFKRKVPVDFNEEKGSVQFAMGRCEIQVEPELLVLRIAAEDDAALAQVKHIVTDHVERFGHHDGLKAEWADAVSL